VLFQKSSEAVWKKLPQIHPIRVKVDFNLLILLTIIGAAGVESSSLLKPHLMIPQAFPLKSGTYVGSTQDFTKIYLSSSWNHSS
jgi:hypothetical protein